MNKSFQAGTYEFSTLSACFVPTIRHRIYSPPDFLSQYDVTTTYQITKKPLSSEISNSEGVPTSYLSPGYVETAADARKYGWMANANTTPTLHSTKDVSTVTVSRSLRACLKSSNEDGNEGKNENLSRNKEFALTIFPKSAEFVEPAEKTLYHPAARQHNKLV